MGGRGRDAQRGEEMCDICRVWIHDFCFLDGLFFLRFLLMLMCILNIFVFCFVCVILDHDS